MSGTASGPATRAGWRSPARVALLASFGLALGLDLATHAARAVFLAGQMDALAAGTETSDPFAAFHAVRTVLQTTLTGFVVLVATLAALGRVRADADHTVRPAVLVGVGAAILAIASFRWYVVWPDLTFVAEPGTGLYDLIPILEAAAAAGIALVGLLGGSLVVLWASLSVAGGLVLGVAGRISDHGGRGPLASVRAWIGRRAGATSVLSLLFLALVADTAIGAAYSLVREPPTVVYAILSAVGVASRVVLLGALLVLLVALRAAGSGAVLRAAALGASLVVAGTALGLALVLAPPSEEILANGALVVAVLALGGLAGGSAWWLALGMVAAGLLELGRGRHSEAGPEMAVT